jgi:hypothetical protein
MRLVSRPLRIESPGMTAFSGEPSEASRTSWFFVKRKSPASVDDSKRLLRTSRMSEQKLLKIEN